MALLLRRVGIATNYAALTLLTITAFTLVVAMIAGIL
jgi:hypothetical protein